MKKQVGIVRYVGEYVIEEGIQRFAFPNLQSFVCTIEKPHLVKTDLVYVSDKKKGSFIFCRKHQDFFDVSVDKREKESRQKCMHA